MLFASVYHFLVSNELLNSSLLIAFVTLLVGSIALYIYWKQHYDEKTNGARVIYSEITSAENKLKGVRQKFFAGEHPVLESIILMPYESWSKYKYLLKKDLKDPEWELIENFYNNCIAYDSAVRLNDSYFHNNTLPNFETFSQYYRDMIQEFIKKNPAKEEFSKADKNKAKHFQDVFLKNAVAMWYSPIKPINDARAALVALESTVSLSTAGKKLKKISKLKG